MECINKSKIDLMNEFRMLWEQHSAWTRMAITSIVFKLPDEEYVVNRLLRNPKDFAIALKPFYGDTIASNFEDLLTEHLVLAANLIKAIMAEDTKKADAIEKKWYQNGKEIAIFLGCINPYWSTKLWEEMFFIHLGFVKSMAVNMINGNYEKSIEIYDENELKILEMADMMSKGIIKQFPCRFNC